MKKIISLKILLLLFAFNSFAQLKKANQYYSNDEYTKAIPLYIEVLKTEPDNIQALEGIANSYRLTRDYTQAEPYYERLIKQNGVDPLNHLYYGLVLKGNNKPKEAKAEFKQYGQAFPSDKRTALLIRSCDELNALTQKVKQVEVSPFAAANTEDSEFSPVVYKDKLVFTSDKKQKLTETKSRYLHVYAVDIKSDKAASAEMLPYPVNSEFHDGPVSFNAEQNMMLLTHVEIEGIKDTNRAKIYFSFLEKNKWSKPVPFEYNSKKYSVAHPALSADGQQLFFASDMFGGNGGLDIYVCQRQGESWGQPQNLGSKINTAGDEAFPYPRKDGTLFFASDGHPGFGGLDIFSSVKNGGKYGNVTNMGADLNSVADDFGVVFTTDSLGYFSSDRQGGKGKDDIYKFTIVNTEMSIEGKVVKGYNANNILKKAELTLLSETGVPLDMETTDNSGYFKFDGLERGRKYHIKIENVPDAKAKYYMLDTKNKFIRETGIDGWGGKYVFRNLPSDPSEVIEITGDVITVAGNLLVGDQTTKPLVNTKVNIIDQDGNIVQTVVTNAFGSFVFTNLPSDKTYIVRVDEKDVQLVRKSKIILTNKSGQEIQATNAGKEGAFTFTLLASDKTVLKRMEVEDVDLRIEFKGKFVGDDKKPLANSVVNVVNDKGEILQTTKTDETGAFYFENLPSDQHYLIKLDEKDPQLKRIKKVVLTNSKGDVVKEVKTIENPEEPYSFSFLPSEKTKLATVYVDDPWLKVLKLKNASVSSAAAKQNLTIVENVYYDYGEYRMPAEANKILDKVINLMESDPDLLVEIASHTDSRSSKEYNLNLSEKRANAAVDYIVKNGIDKARISGKGYGESKLINNCADGVTCSEEEHAKNRRTEFQIARKKKP